eukprot:gene15511-biopygen5199
MPPLESQIVLCEETLNIAKKAKSNLEMKESGVSRAPNKVVLRKDSPNAPCLWGEYLSPARRKGCTYARGHTFSPFGPAGRPCVEELESRGCRWLDGLTVAFQRASRRRASWRECTH